MGDGGETEQRQRQHQPSEHLDFQMTPEKTTRVDDYHFR
jgi:hypothetical protein